jgi:hypothetical protein
MLGQGKKRVSGSRFALGKKCLGAEGFRGYADILHESGIGLRMSTSAMIPRGIVWRFRHALG